MNEPCFCGSGTAYEQCCEPIIQNQALAHSAEQLMRARYSAYAVKAIDFLHDSLHPDGREEFDFDATRQWAENSEWVGLTVHSTRSGGLNDKVGSVEFTAVYRDKENVEHRHSERSQFKKIDNCWHFCDGQSIKPEKTGRNDPCPCGSGKKYKKCCGA